MSMFLQMLSYPVVIQGQTCQGQLPVATETEDMCIHVFDFIQPFHTFIQFKHLSIHSPQERSD